MRFQTLLLVALLWPTWASAQTRIVTGDAVHLIKVA
jgi:hypothetical protein